VPGEDPGWGDGPRPSHAAGPDPPPGFPGARRALVRRRGVRPAGGRLPGRRPGHAGSRRREGGPGGRPRRPRRRAARAGVQPGASKPFAWPVDAAFRLRYLPQTANRGAEEQEVDEAALEVAFYEGEAIDLGQLLREQFYLALPMKPLCRPDCRGLCPTCGANRNAASCGCDARWRIPAWPRSGAWPARPARPTNRRDAYAEPEATPFQDPRPQAPHARRPCLRSAWPSAPSATSRSRPTGCARPAASTRGRQARPVEEE